MLADDGRGAQQSEKPFARSITAEIRRDDPAARRRQRGNQLIQAAILRPDEASNRPPQRPERWPQSGQCRVFLELLAVFTGSMPGVDVLSMAPISAAMASY